MFEAARKLALVMVTALAVMAAPAAAAETIVLSEDGFDPPRAVVDAGETVHFESEASGKWSVVSDAGLFDSGELAPAGGFTMAPSVPGTHVYRSAHGTEHVARITVRTSALPGKPGDPAAPRIPDIVFPPVGAGDVDVHPSFGVEASTTRIMLGFRQDATVGEVNAALDDAHVRIAGGLPEAGMLLVEAPGSSGETGSRFASLESALASLRTSPGVAYAAMSTVQDTKAVPRRADDATAGTGSGWDWDDPFEKGNWGLAWSQFPEAWNLLESIKRKQPKVITGIVDGGFEEHADLPGLEVQPQVCRAGGQDCLPLQNRPNEHGNHVAGIIGAAYDNEVDGAPSRSRGVSGANPVAKMYGYPVPEGGLDPQRPWRAAMLADQQLELFTRILSGRPAELRVINYSMGAADFNGENWQDAYGDKLCGPGAADDDLPEMQAPMKEVCTPNNLDSWQREIANAGRAAAPIVRNAAQQGVMIVQAAGNEGDTFCPSGQCQAIDAAARGEFAWVAKHWDDAGVGADDLANPVFVVQSMKNDGARRADSTLGGTIAAPGDRILSTALGQGYVSKGGSSMATPYVTGLIGQLLADDPSLSIADVRRLVVGWAGGRPGTTGGAEFTYEMADRMNRDVMGDGLVDYMTHTSDLKPIRWKVELDACAASANGKTVATYTWSVDGEEIASTPDCTYTWKPFDEGTYNVTLTVTGAGGEQSSVTKPVEVKDLVIVSVGDSIASGEGNPDVESPNARWQLERCHRTAFAGPAQAARWLEGADERSSITFLHLACSGGRIEGDKDGVGPDAPLKAGFEGVGGLLTPYEGVTEDVDDSACALSLRTDLSVCEPPQLDQAVELLDGRQPDALTVSIGANDMWFSSILTECIIPLNSCHENEDGKGLFEWRIQLLPSRYRRLAAAIKSRWPDMPSENVIITQYPDLTTDENGEIDMSCGTAVGISEAEQQWAHDVVIPALNAQVADAAAAHGWTVAEGIPESFHRHGYCSSDPWVVDITGTFWDQGDKNGAFHPNYEGHSAYARKITAALRERLGLQNLTRNRPLRDSAPRLNAFRALAGNGHARRVADVNDPSKDGNRRVERKVAADGSVTETEDGKSSHAEGERTAPDGRVDMRDLRRFRDAWLQRCLTETDGCPAAGDITLDGGPDHPKRDLNLDGCVKGGLVGCGARESWFSRFDFNGDRSIDPFAEAMVPWKEDGSPADGRTEATTMSDLDVLEAAWSGGDGAEGWKKDDVEELVRSGDVEVHAGAVLDDGATKAQVQVRQKGGANVGPERTIRRSEGHAVLTVPLTTAGAEYEIVATATTDRGAMSSVSEPFSLEYGEDRFVAVCPDVSLKAAPDRVPAGGEVTSVVTATVEKCGGRDDVQGKDVSFTLEPSAEGATVEALEPQTDAQGRAQAIFTPGDQKGTYTVKASVQVEEDAEPLEAEMEIEVVPLVTIKYVWKQTIEDWHESGTTRWGFDAFMPDCVGAGAPYCIEEFEMGLDSQTLGGVQRAGTLKGGGERFKLTEDVSNSAASSLSTWNVTLNNEEQRNLDGGSRAQWHVTDPAAYADHPLTGLRADDQSGALRLTGMQAVGDLPYHYQLTNQVWGTTHPTELHQARYEYLLIPQGSRKLRFAAAPDEDVVFPKGEDGFGQYVSCGRLDKTLQHQKGYYVQGPSDYIPGAISIDRKPTYEVGDRPMPIGESRLKVRYAFAATVAYEGQPVAEPQLPDCTRQNPPQADFEIKPSTDPAKEGRVVHFADRSSDPENDIVERAWDFGDGDGGEGLGATPQHMYDDDGDYTVTLTVTDAEGNEDSVTKEIRVENEPPEASLDDVTAGVGELQVKWRMLDPGKTDKAQLRWKLSSTNPAFPTHQGTDQAGVWHVGPFTNLPAGTYPVRLDVEDKDGATASDSAVVVVTENPPPPPPPPVGGSFPTCDANVTLSAEEKEFLELVNEYRERNGVGPVGVSATLTRAADRHALDMSTHNVMKHEGSDGSLWPQRAYESGYPKTAGVGENIAKTDTAEDSMWAWRGSLTGHNENMLNPAWKAIGISREKGDTWYWATSYGTVQDCPADTEQGLAARSAVFEPTPTKGGVETEETEARTTERATRAARTAESAAFEEPARSGDFAAAADTTSAYGPTPAVALTRSQPRAGRPVEVLNRSRDARGEPIAAKVSFGDTSENPQHALAAGAWRTHAYPSSEDYDSYELRMTAQDAAGRDALLRHWVSVDPILPASLSLVDSTQIAVAGGEYDVSVRVRDPNTWQPIEGIELSFTSGEQVVTALTNAQGVATATVTLLDTEAEQTIKVAYAGSDDLKAASVSKRVLAKTNHAPTAHAGGPYVTGEGGTLALNGSKSAEPDPTWFDHIAHYDWDLDGDGAYDDAHGKLPPLIEGDELDEKVCGGPCDATDPYTIGLRVKDSHGATATATSTVRFVADFDLTLGGEAKTIGPNQTNSFAVTVLGSRSYGKPVTLSVGKLPGGVTASFSKNPVTPTDVSILTLTGGPAPVDGTHDLEVTATDGQLTRTVADKLKVSFGLIPVCQGTISGIVKDKTTGAPLADAQVSVTGASTKTDTSGRYVLEQVSLGTYNAPKSHTVGAALNGYWTQTGTGVAACGAMTRVDIQLLDQRKGQVGGKVVDKATGEPLENAVIREQSCFLGCQYFKVADAGTGGTWSYQPLLGNQNTERFWTSRADAPGYWHQDKSLSVKEGVPVKLDYELVERCDGKLAGGEVRYLGSNQLVPNAGIDVYGVPGTSRIELETDENGKFVVDRAVPLGYNNSTATYRVDAQPPVGAPAGTVGDVKQFQVTHCGHEASVTLYLKTPVPNYGKLTGKVTDEETGAPIKEQYVRVCGSHCALAKTNLDGIYTAENIHVGDDGVTNRSVQVSSEPDGYWKTETSVTVRKDQTSTLNFKLLKRRTGALKVSARDSVTGAPIPYAQVVEGSCNTFCLQTGRDGDVTKTGIGLGNRNLPVSKTLTASASGYWPQSKSVTIKAGETSQLLYQLQPECEPAKVVGTVVNAETQAPIHKASVAGGLDHAVQTDVNGRFEIAGIKPSLGNNPRDVTLTASAAGFYSESKTIKIFCGAKITVEFGSRTSQTGTIIGTVIDDDTDLPMKDVFIGTSFGGIAKTNQDGNYTIQNAPLGDLDTPREWTVIAQPAGRKASVKTVVVEAGKQSRRDFLFSSENERPVANPKEIALDEDADHEVTVSGSDADGDTLTHHVMRFPQHGVLIGRAPNLTYRPDDDYHGTDSFEFIVNDGAASSERATVDVTVRPVNDPPSGRADHIDVVPDSTTRIPAATLLANDIDADDEPLEIIGVEATMTGTTVALDGDEVVLTPKPGYTNTQEVVLFEYTLRDGAGKTSTAMVYVRVDHGPAAPRCVDAEFEVLQGATLEDELGCTDVNGDELTYALVDGPAQGTLELAEDGSFSYAAPQGFLGEATFTYRASDGELESDLATATIAVVEENAAPACADAGAETDEDAPVEIDLGCTDADGDPVLHELLGQPAHGTLERLSEGRYRYTPAANWSGEDSFGFRATDGKDTSSSATARITVRPVNDAPDAADGDVALAEDAEGVPVGLAALVSDEETPAGELAIEIVDGPGKGSLSGTGGTRTYAPKPNANGADTLTYRVTDAGGKTAEAEVAFAIAPVNDVPVCKDVALGTDAGVAGEVAPDCSDVEGDALTYEIAEQGAKGAASVAGGKLRFAPAAGKSGEDAFTYLARDGEGPSAPAQVAVQIEPAPPENAAPVAKDDALEGDEDTPLTVPAATLTGNDTDPEGGPVTVTKVDDAAHGAASLAAGSVTFTPEKDFHGKGGFRYTVADAEGKTATARVEVTVRSVNDAPVAGADEVAAQQDVPVSIPVETLLGNDRDADGDELAVAAVDGAEHGAAALDGAAVRFTPAAGFHGEARFRYEAADAHGGRHRATVAVKVAKAPVAPPEPEERQEVAGEQQQSGGDLLLGCTDRAVVLEDVVPDGRRVKLLGVAERRHAGKRAEVRFVATGKVVARPVVGPDGRFSATAPMPTGKLRHSNKARYTATVAGERSLALKLERRMLVTRVTAADGKVTIAGRVTGPLAARASDRAIEVQRRRSCADTEVVARIQPGKDGRFRATLAAPAGERAAVYRLRARVRRSAASTRLFDTYTLPRAVDF